MAIFHYTDLNGLKGIIENNSLWATNINFLNDREEFHHGYKCFLNSLEYIGPPYYLPEMRKTIEEMLTHFISQQGRHIYTISFCSVADQLSQWRGYGREQGICIEFDEAMLSSVLKHHNYDMSCGEVIYTKENSTLEAKDEINRLIDVNGPGSIDYRKDSFERSIYIYHVIRKTIPFFKHKGFIEEREYRFAFTASNQVPDVKFRVSRGGYVPYIILKPLDGIKLPIKKIIIGPSKNVQDVDAGIRFFLKHYGCDSIEIEHSKVPYRT